MPRPKLTFEDRVQKAHENMLNGMVFLYTCASHDDKEQYMRLKTAYGFLDEMLKNLDKKFKDEHKK